MQIIVANTAGFCFGVDRAVSKVYEMMDDTPLYTYGPIIHNRQVVEDMSHKGIRVVESIDELKNLEKGRIILRSHGVSPEEIEQIEALGFTAIDATCPFVKRIHEIVRKMSDEGHKIIIIGSPNHPEVTGIKGWCKTQTYIVEDVADLERIPLNEQDSYCVVSQTTFDTIKYKEIVNKLQNGKFRVMIYETICNATHERQEEALEIAKKATKMIVIGGKHSSNTQKLYKICKSQCEDTFHIETIDDLVLNVFDDNDIIGITAGASTPKHIIEEVILYVRRTKF